MVAMMERDQGYRSDPFTRKMEQLYLNIFVRQHSINNMIVVFRDDEEINIQQCQEAVARLRSLRVDARAAHIWLGNMHPANTERIRPLAVIGKLDELETNIAETILLVSVFRQICQSLTVDRVELHLCTRESMLQIKRSLNDCLSQFGALVTLTEDLGGGL